MSDTLLAVAAIFVALSTFIPAVIAAWNSVAAKQEAGDAKREATVAKERAAVAAATTEATASEVQRQLTTLTLNVDGRLSQLLSEVQKTATLTGRAEGVEQERSRQEPPTATATLTAVTDAIAESVTDTQEKVTDIHHVVIPPTESGPSSEEPTA